MLRRRTLNALSDEAEITTFHIAFDQRLDPVQRNTRMWATRELCQSGRRTQVGSSPLADAVSRSEGMGLGTRDFLFEPPDSCATLSASVRFVGPG